MRVLDFFKVLSAVFIITVCALAQTTEQFQFEVTVTGTTTANRTFAIPLSGFIGGNANGKNYNWNINWGDGATMIRTQASVATGTSSAGITHGYNNAGTYTITITPAGSTDAWLAAFGFGSGVYDSGANAQDNRNKVTKVISPLTPNMTRTAAQITGTPPTYEWAYTFYGCTNLTMDNAFTFSPEWNTITSVGNYFARSMFNKCSGATFTMGSNFNLPPNITTMGDYFADSMFYNCSGAAFMVNDVFKFPLLTQYEVNKPSVLRNTFRNAGTGRVQTRTIQSIVNGNPLPNSARNTFTNSGFPDLSYAPTNWGGGGNTNSITINTQPAPTTTVTYNSITGSLSVAASAAQGATLSYQWYSNTANNTTSGTSISGATNASYTIPTNSTAGTRYYYCVVTSWWATSQTSNAATVTVAKADYSMSGITFANKTETYNGQPQSIVIGGTLPSGVTVSYANNAKTDAGTYTVTANFATTNNNYNAPASRTATLTINKANPAYTLPTGLTATYGQTLANVSLTGGWSWMTSTTSVGNAGSQTHKAKFTPADINNYNVLNDIDVTVTVNKATGSFVATSALSTTYTPGLTLASLNSQLPAGYEWSAPTTTLNAGNEQSFAAAYTHPSGNYNSATGNITVNVAKATGTFVATSALNTTYTPTLTLANVTPPANYAWVTPTTSLSAGNNQTFAATYNDPSGNYNPVTGNITVNVAKAAAPAGVARTELVVAGYAHGYHFDLETLLPNIAGLKGVTYSPVITSDASNILGALSYTSGNTLTIPVNNVSGAGLSATITVTVSSHNYENVTAVITVTTVNKKLVEITGITIAGGVYNGEPRGYSGTLIFTRPDNNETVTDVTFEILYESTDGGSYSSEDAPTNAGEYRLTVKVPASDPAYIGDKEFEFTLAKADYDISGITFAGKTVTYNGQVQSVAIGGALPVGVTVSYANNDKTNAGTYTVTANFATTNNNYNIPASKTATLTIGKAAGTGTVSIAGWTYGQAANSPMVSGQPTEYDAPIYAYSVQGANNYTATVPTNAGSYTVKATFAATTNYNEHSATANFTIAKATLAATAYTIPTGLIALVGQTLASVTLPNNWSWVTSTDLVGAVGNQTHKAKFTPSDIANYNVVDNIDVTVTVSAPVSISKTEKSGNGFGVIFKNSVVSDKLEIVKVVLPDGKVGKTASVIIYDNTGNVVFSGEGENAKSWDLRNKSGRIAANGGYLVIVEAKDRNENVYYYSAKVVVKR